MSLIRFQRLVCVGLDVYYTKRPWTRERLVIPPFLEPKTGGDERFQRGVVPIGQSLQAFADLDDWHMIAIVGEGSANALGDFSPGTTTRWLWIWMSMGWLKDDLTIHRSGPYLNSSRVYTNWIGYWLSTIILLCVLISNWSKIIHFTWVKG